MARDLIDLLWRDHPDAPRGGTRGPQSKVTTAQAVSSAITLADAEGLPAVTVRRLAADLGISGMALYTHVGSRDDLLVLMADAARAGRPRSPYASERWRARVRQVAETDLALYTAHGWLLDITDPRTSLGPGTIAAYDHDLHAFDHTGLTDLDRNASLTFVADFTRAAAHAHRPAPHTVDMAAAWSAWHQRLDAYLGDEFPLARRVGAVAGEAMNTSYSPQSAWKFGLDRVLDAVQSLIDRV
ncbi:TetR/AcrR family transcriptional regulator C-terminal domain-containing protein [Rhodococcus sp. F64268]|uniref:TetR/AcrR family transcriptional regulator n=1 Tax=Rhodococcus sp. F64268 TaxID=2926402 RepID=UPI001FF52DDF|nr:TetR/AcrR family transcriptional regulator C-terminal domain-containing protein [Rhodococcus sp. F64268]MCK0093499.1 TetR/AcrR family transcriptional regulator C-terminal domain-containing protein [Rhodococcus sp. F64268]